MATCAGLAQVDRGLGPSATDIDAGDQPTTANGCEAARFRVAGLLQPAQSHQGVLRLAREFCSHPRHPYWRTSLISVPPLLILLVNPAPGRQIGTRILIERTAFGGIECEQLLEGEAFEVWRVEHVDGDAVP